MSAELSAATVFRQRAELLVQPLDDELVLATPDQADYYGLGDTGRRIWELLAEPLSVAQLCEALTAEFDVDDETCARDVVSFLTELELAGVVERVD